MNSLAPSSFCYLAIFLFQRVKLKLDEQYLKLMCQKETENKDKDHEKTEEIIYAVKERGNKTLFFSVPLLS